MRQEFRDNLFKLAPDAIVELCYVDLNPIGHNLRVGLHKYDAPTVIFNGITFDPAPIRLSKFTQSSKGLPTPTVTIGDALGTISRLLKQYDNLKGAEFTRWQTLKKYIGLPFDNNYLIDYPDTFIISRIANKNRMQVTIELASPFESLNRQLPTQIITRSSCTATFKKAETGCGYVGAATFCTRKLIGANSCEENFGVGNALDFNGAPGVDFVG